MNKTKRKKCGLGNNHPATSPTVSVLKEFKNKGSVRPRKN
jgi:hypothetical protein